MIQLAIVLQIMSDIKYIPSPLYELYLKNLASAKGQNELANLWIMAYFIYSVEYFIKLMLYLIITLRQIRKYSQ